ncbi:hypothetical protein C922_02954 [Plasmodium inui San Antonio 1]|uniref:Uncharacterized protein n=1 Tax=Plasmodium inui San Antonio 1 TaxID=1237626 RepID=W7A5Z6_9APIC|nr:hypothetical protein C922_02954 [Plasmodium inui San Antonio 1]EUD66633.1 hypothetical protein C922_02954 [Plasmodium inui San Antonio 1]
MHMSDVPPGGEEAANDEAANDAAAEGEVTEVGSQVEQKGMHDLTAGGRDAGWGNSDGWLAEKDAEGPAREAKKVRKSLGKAGKASKGKAKKKEKDVAGKGAKKVAAKKGKAMEKEKRKGESSRTDDPFLTDSEEELYNDDNLFMPRALKKGAHKKGNQKSKKNEQKLKAQTNQISKKKHDKREKKNKCERIQKRKKKNNMKSKFCTAECLPLGHYSEELEKELASYATSGFKKYLKFLKNYKTTVGVQEKVVSKKPRHMYV